MTRARLLGLFRPIVRDESGQELAETAMILPFLLVLALGVVEFGTMFSTSHTLTSLGREGANIAARGTPLDTVNALMLESGADISLGALGGAITTHVVVEDSVPMIQAQAATPAYHNRSRLGRRGQPAQGLGSLAGAEGANFFVVELFYVRERKTPVWSLLESLAGGNSRRASIGAQPNKTAYEDATTAYAPQTSGNTDSSGSSSDGAPSDTLYSRAIF
jgi:hypothetical protein